MKRGVVYIAFGDKFINEILRSAKSVKKHNPNLHITAFVDKEVKSEYIDETKIINATHLRPKVDYLSSTPYEQTLFLDTDTLIVRNIEDMFDLLEAFDFAGTHDLARKRKKYSKIIPEYASIPYSFSEINTGVLVFKKNEPVLALFERWKKYFYRHRKDCPWDQPSVRVSLWKSIQKGLQFSTFPVEYNIRSKANREKQNKLHHEFGDEHLAPRIYHMHTDKFRKEDFMEY